MRATRRMRLARAAVMLGAVAMFLVGCSGSDGGSATSVAPSTDAPEGTLSRESLADELAQWVCDGAASCCSSAGIEFDRGGCLEKHREAELRRWTGDDVRQFSESMASLCSSLIRETPPSCGNPRGILKTCFRVTDGVLELGEACERKEQCRGQREGLVTCVDGACVEKPQVNEPCEVIGACNQCMGRAFCVQGEDGIPQCRQRIDGPAAGVGERCADDAPGLPTTAADGTPAQEIIKCQADLVCEPFEGVCVRRHLPGEACHPTWGNILCMDGICENGICTRNIELGEPCDGRGCVEGLYCDDVEERCAEHVTEGEECGHTSVIDRQCQPGLGCHFDEATNDRRCMTSEKAWCARAS